MLKSFLFAASLILVSCSQMPSLKKDQKGSGKEELKTKNKDLTAEQVRKLNEEASKRVSKQLKELALAAKASGKDKVQFLASDMYLKASAAQMEGDFQTGNIILEQLVELVPEEAFIRKKYAVGLIRTGELEKSQKILEGLYDQSKQKDHQIGLILAGVYSSLGKTELALNAYEGILKQNPANEDACVFLSKTHVLKGSFGKAVKTLKTCEKETKGQGIFSYYLGKLHVDEGRLKEAQEHFKRAAKIEPDFSQATMALGLTYEEQGKSQKAIEIYKSYLAKKPNDTLILSRLVQLMFAAEKFSEAIPFAERLSDYDPENLNLKVKLGILYSDKKDYDKAISTFKELLTSAPGNDKILYYLGAIYQEMKKYENAVDFFTRVPATSGLYQDSSLQAAQMLSSLAFKERKEEEIENEKRFHRKFVDLVEKKAKELPEMKIEFLVIKAGYFENLQENAKAIQCLEEVAQSERFGDNHKYYLASLYEKEKLYEKAFSLVQTILKENPNDAYAYNFLGYSLLTQGKELDQAYKYISKAVELKPEDGYIRDSLGWYYYKKGNVEKALTELQKAVEAVPDDISIQKHIAIVYGKLRRFNKAKEYIVNAIGLARFETERKELYEALENLDSKRIPASFLDE